VRVAKVAGVRGGLPLLAGEQALEVANVIWSTGFPQDFSWIDLPVLGENGRPVHERGVVPALPGLCFVGLLFLYSVTSDVLPGVGRDAKRIAKHIAGAQASVPRSVRREVRVTGTQTASS
jgi:putative flavoprotein involved in K+ transport